MDFKRFEKAYAHALAKKKPLAAPIAQLKAPPASFKPFVVMADKQYGLSTSPMCRKSPVS